MFGQPFENHLFGKTNGGAVIISHSKMGQFPRFDFGINGVLVELEEFGDFFDGEDSIVQGVWLCHGVGTISS